MRAKFIFIFILFSGLAFSQDESWELTRESDDIKVYTRKQVGEKFKEIKILAGCQSTLNAIMAAFDDADSHKEWVYKTPETYPIERVDDNTLIYYVSSDLPFPLYDRDIVIKYKWTQDPETKVIFTESLSLVGRVEEKESKVRVLDFLSQYRLTPKADGWIDIEYYAKLDPAGSLPAWLVNLVVTTGPVKTMKSFFELLDSGRYDDVQVKGVSELY